VVKDDMNTSGETLPLERRLSDRFGTALTWATELHREQPRKGTTIPYVSHLLAVVSLALEHGADEEEAIAALLHDAIEDRKATRREIDRRYGARVAGIVVACSDTDQAEKPAWRERKEAYLAHLADAPASALLVSACDKLHNARAILADYREIGDALWNRFNASREATLWYYRELVSVFTRRRDERTGRLVAELGRVVDELDALIATRLDLL
jgi:(p)ppGpp synthase/HD superfamily hydrolase